MWLLRSAHKHIGQDTLSEYLDGRLQGRPLERVERQLGECDACRQDLAELRATVAMMQGLPMEAPRRSFVMSAPPPEPARAGPMRGRPNLALRAPNWVYAGAASVAALALAVTITVDATGGLTSDPLRRDVETTALATAATSDQLTVTSQPPAEAAAEAELAARSGTGATLESAAAPGEDAAPLSLAAAAPAAATADPSVQGEPTGGGAIAFGAGATSAPVVPVAPSAPDGEAALGEPAVAPVAAPAPETAAADVDASSAANQTAKSPTIEEPAEPPAPLPEGAVPELFDEGADGDTSIWWRVLEAAAGVLAVLFLAGLVLRRRAGRRDFP